MPETFILIPGRTSEQGTTLNEGGYTDGYQTSMRQVASEGMRGRNLKDGDLVCL